MSSTYSSFIPPYNETPILDSIAQLADQLGQQQYSWAGQQFATNSTLTDQVVNNFLTASQKDMDLAQNMSDRYQNVFEPQENALVRDANIYASDARVRSEMGRAESDQAQAGDQAKANLERNLQSFGIDPSSGRYAELEAAQDAQRNAAAAQAGQAARYNTEQTGRNLRTQAIQVGQQLPGQVVNSLNNAMQGFAGAENAKLSNTNTGVNAFGNADKFLNTAMALKYPPLGQAGSRGSILNTTATNGSSNGGTRSGGGPGSMNLGGGGGSLGGGAGGYNGLAPNTSAMDNYGAGGGGLGGFNYPGALVVGGAGGSQPDASTFDAYGSGDFGSANQMDPWANEFQYPGDVGGGYSDTGQYFGGEGGASTGGGFNDTGGYTTEGFGNDGSSPFSGYDTGAGDYGYTDTGGYGVSDYSGAGADNGYFDNSAGSYGGDYGGGASDYNDESSYYGDYAAGGAIPENGPTSGGFVPPQASPSMGQQTDDVNAHVNVGEFIIPRDVAAWKGQEFFQKLIQQSRKNRASAPAKGKPSNRPTNGPPSFVSGAR